MKIERFEDIDSWREARTLVRMIYEVTKQEGFSRDFELKNQIRRAAIAVMSNIAEGFDRQSNREFIQFLVIARASVSEVKSRLYVALDQDYIDKKTFQDGYSKSTTIVNLINGLLRYLRNNPQPST
ncbi:MAG: four helix bundle protein [Candidatus Binatia bacterium]